MRVAWKGPYWEPRDAWVGFYWNVDKVKRYSERSRRWNDDRRMNLYVCLVPCLPIRIRWWLR